MGKRNESIYKLCMSYNQDGRHTRSKIFSYKTNSHMIVKLGMEHHKLKLYTVCINDVPEFTLTYLTTMATLIFELIVGPDIR